MYVQVDASECYMISEQKNWDATMKVKKKQQTNMNRSKLVTIKKHFDILLRVQYALVNQSAFLIPCVTIMGAHAHCGGNII